MVSRSPYPIEKHYIHQSIKQVFLNMPKFDFASIAGFLKSIVGTLFHIQVTRNMLILFMNEGTLKQRICKLSTI